jgi:PTH1 family peptidyl-tRNA hydrolase
MPVVVGLWNPEPQYRGTRHNVGAEVVETLCERWLAPFERAPSKVKARIATTRIGGDQVILGLPKASMNVSGPPVQSILSYFKQAPEQLLVAYDDIDMPFGKLRVAYDRGAGGHNGIRSIEQSLGTREFWRLKIGVGRPPGNKDAAAHVLSKFSKKERPDVDVIVNRCADVVERWLEDPERSRETAAELSF